MTIMNIQIHYLWEFERPYKTVLFKYCNEPNRLVQNELCYKEQLFPRTETLLQYDVITNTAVVTLTRKVCTNTNRGN